MKRILPVVLFIAILCSCTESGPQLTYEGFDLNIDSVYDITSTSVSIRAKLKIRNQGNVPLASIYVAIRKEEGNVIDTLSRQVDFKNVAPVVTITIDSLTPNTHYYVTTGGRYNPPETEEYRWLPHITSYESAFYQSFYTSPEYTY
ncbi:MAG TPA: hypothetical protein VFK73_01675 [Paludibacter sp.]|nr:hypothetical protein [Paludibacter sp.]